MQSELLITFIILIGGLLIIMATGLPIAFCFLLVTLGGAIYFWGFDAGTSLLIHNMRSAISKFVFLPLMMFILLGDVMFESGIAFKMLDVLNKWLGKIPGRLSILTVAFCTLFATMSGSQMATASMMGTVMTPEMEKRGYKREMSLGPIIGAGGLAMIIPPSNLAVLLAAIAGISVGKLLIGGYLPGLLLACLYIGYIVVRCKLNPSLAPIYEIAHTPVSVKLKETGLYVLPLVAIIFLVMGLIFLGWATPSESAALGAIGSLCIAAIFKKLNLGVLGKCAMSAVKTAAMVLLIIATAQTFSQILAFSGVTQALAKWVTGLELAPIFIVLVMMLILFIMGCFLDTVGMIMITMPIFMPIINSLGLDIVWFGILVLINMELAGITPPVGMMLYIVRGIAPQGTTMGEVIKAAIPYVSCDVVAILIILLAPPIATWLPNLMRG